MYFAHPIDFCSGLTNFEKIKICQVWFLFGMIPGVGYIRSILEQSINNKMVSQIKLKCLLYWYVFTLMPNL